MIKTNCDNCNLPINKHLHKIKQNNNYFAFCCCDCSNYHKIFNPVRQAKPKSTFKRMIFNKLYSYELYIYNNLELSNDNRR